MKFIRVFIVAVFVVLTGMYLNLLGPVKDSQADTKADNAIANIKVHAVEVQTPSSGNPTYKIKWQLTNVGDANRTISYQIDSFHCDDGNVSNGCYGDKQITTGAVTFTSTNQTLETVTVSRDPSSQFAGQYCGTYQVDIFFPGINSAGWYQSAGWVNTHLSCPNVPPTATPTQPVCTTSTSERCDSKHHITVTHNTCTGNTEHDDGLLPNKCGVTCEDLQTCNPPMPTDIPQITASCTFDPATLNLNKDQTGSSTLHWSTTETTFNQQINVCLKKSGNDTILKEFSVAGGGGVNTNNTISYDGFIAPATYIASIFVKGTDDNSCTGTPLTTCTLTANQNNNTNLNCGDNNTVNQSGTNNNVNANCNNNSNTNNNSSNSNSSSNSNATGGAGGNVNNSGNSNNTNNQTQSQTINITYASYAPTGTQIQVQPAPKTTSLPNTGSPLSDTLSLIAMIPAGFLIKKFTNLG